MQQLVQVTSDDATIDVRVDGSGDENIVFIHGFPLNREIWNAQARALAPRYRVVLPDLRGSGASSVPGGPYLMETLAGDIAAVLDRLAVERATIVGHSLGGYVALAFARMYAERVARLALVCSRLHADDAARAKARIEKAERAETRDSIDEFVEDAVANLPAKSEKNIEIQAKIREIAGKNTARGLAALSRGMAMRDDASDIAPELAMPVLVVAGGRDAVVPLAESEATAAAFPGGRLAVCEASGHLPMLEEPERLSALLLDFIGG